MTPDSQKVQSALAYIPAHDRDMWLRMGMAIKSELGDAGYDIWDEWSRSAENYKERDSKTTWRSIKPTGKVTAGTLMYEAQQRGWKLSGTDQRPNPAEIERQRKERARREAKAAAELAERNARARDQAQEIWKRCQPLTAHDYATAKGIKAYGAKLYRGPLIISGNRVDGSIVMPLVDTGGTIHTLQYITPKDDKLFPYGGAKSGHYFAIGKPAQRVIVCEGYATACSIHEATGEAVAVAFDRTNLGPVATAIRAKYPDLELVIAADNDAWTDGNPGVKNATEAAQSVNARVAVPTFKDSSSKPTDYNDLHKLQGLDAVRAQIEGATEPEQSAQGVLSVLSAPGTDADGYQPLKPIRAELYSVDKLEPAIIPEPYRDWLADIAERMQCPLDFVAAPALVMTSAVIGAACGVKPKREDDGWLVIPNLWGGVIGNPSRLKTPALNAAMYPLKMLERRANKEYEDAQHEYEAELMTFEARKAALRDKAKKGAKARTNTADIDSAQHEYAMLQKPEPPVWRRYQTSDPTQEKMTELLRDNPRGMLLFRDEVTGLLASWDKDGRESDRAFYLETWNGNGTYTTDRIGRGTVHVESMCVSLLGGIQPAKLTSYLYRAMRGHDNDGLMQRIQLLVYPDDLPSWKLIDRQPDQAAQSSAFEIVRGLAEIDYTQHGATKREGDRQPWFRFNDDAQELFYAWWTELEQDKLRGDGASIVKEHLGKYRSLFPSLALIFHLIDIAAGKASGPISLRAAQLAAAWCEYLESHANRIYGMVSDLTPRAAANLCAKIKADALPDTFTAREVYRKGWELLDDSEVVKEACEMLEAHGWLKTIERDTVTNGRPVTLSAYQVNPKAKGGANG